MYFLNFSTVYIRLYIPNKIEYSYLLGGSRGRVSKVAEFQRSKSFDHFTAVTGVGSSPALAICETSQVLLPFVSGGFPGVLPSRYK